LDAIQNRTPGPNEGAKTEEKDENSHGENCKAEGMKGSACAIDGPYKQEVDRLGGALESVREELFEVKHAMAVVIEEKEEAELRAKEAEESLREEEEARKASDLKIRLLEEAAMSAVDEEEEASRMKREQREDAILKLT